MPSPLCTHDREMHNLSGSIKFKEWGSSGLRTKKLKRENGAKEWTGKTSEPCERVEQDLEPLHRKRKTMDARVYKSLFKRPPSKDISPGSHGVSTGSGSQLLPRVNDNKSEGRIRSHDKQKSLQARLKPDIIKLCEVLKLPQEDVRVMVGKFLEYVIDKHEVSREPQTKLEALLVSLCWNAASLLKYKIDKRESFLLAKQHLHFRCSVEELSDVDSALRKLRKNFVIDVGNVKELDSSNKSISAIKETKKDREPLPKSRIEGKEFQRCVKRVERKLEKRMERLDRNKHKKIDEFHRIWEKRKVQLLEQHRQSASIVSSWHSNNPVKLNELKRLEDELRKKMEEHKYQKGTRLKELDAHYLAKKTKEIGKKGRWLEKLKSSYLLPCDETGSGYRTEIQTVCQRANHETSSGNSNIAEKSSSPEENLLNGPLSDLEVIEGAGMELVGDLHRPGNDPENIIATKSSFSEKQLSNGPPSNVEEVIEGGGQELVGDMIPGNVSKNNIAKPSSSREQLLNGPTSNVEEVIEGPGKELIGDLHRPDNDSENNIAAKKPSSKEQLPNELSSSVAEMIKSAGIELVGGLHQSGIASQDCSSQNNIVTDLHSSEVQLLLGASPNVREVMKSAANELQKRPHLSTHAQMANIEAPLQKDDGQIPSADISVETNMPTSASASPGSDHALVLPNPLERQQLSPSAIIHVDTNQPTSASTSVVDQTPPSEESYCPPLPVDTNRCHPVPASVVELAPHRETPIFNTEASRQLENSQLLQSIVGPVPNPITSSLTHVRDESPRPNQPEPRIINTDNHHPVVDAPILFDHSSFRVRLETTPSINSYTGDLRSHPILQGARQPAPQMTAQRLTSNPLYNEYERLCRESERVVDFHENMKSQLKSDCEKEIAEIRKKYDKKMHEAEEEFSLKKKEVDVNSMKVLMNGLYAQAFQNMAEYRPTFKLPPEVPSYLMQQVHLPHSQAQPIFSPSNFTGMVTPRPNVRDHGIQPPPLVHHFRPNFASVLQRAPAQPELPRRSTYQPSVAVGGNPYLLSAIVPNFQNQMATRSSSVLQSVLASGSNLGLLSQAMVANNGGSGRTDMRNSGLVTGYICLSDDE